MARQELDYYETLPGLTWTLLRSGLVTLYDGDVIVDPCVGNNAILDVILAHSGDTVRTLSADIDHEKPQEIRSTCHRWINAATRQGWLDLSLSCGPIDWVITNPPFNVAHDIIPYAVNTARKGVAMLLPLRFFEPTGKRLEVLYTYPWSGEIIIGQPRPSFVGRGTDSVTVFWAVWNNMIQDQGHIKRVWAIDPQGRWRSKSGDLYDYDVFSF